MRWEVSIDPGKRDILLASESGRFRPEVFSGGIVPDLFHAFRALEAPVNGNYILDHWTVGVPAQFRGFADNMRERRFLRISSDKGAELVLDFHRDRVPESLIQDLRRIFSANQKPSTEAAGDADEGHHLEIPAGASAEGRPRKGNHSLHGYTANRQGRWAERPG